MPIETGAGTMLDESIKREVEKTQPISSATSKYYTSIVKIIASVIFGLLIPVALMWMSFGNIAELQRELKYEDRALQTFMEAKPKLTHQNDYYMLSLFYLEDSLQRSLANKQQMKVAAMHIGFALMSLGLMFIILGFKDHGGSGVDTKASYGDFEIDLKTGSTGLVVVLIGALISAGGALIPNKYTANTGPQFSSVTEINSVDPGKLMAQFNKECINL